MKKKFTETLKNKMGNRIYQRIGRRKAVPGAMVLCDNDTTAAHILTTIFIWNKFDKKNDADTYDGRYWTYIPLYSFATHTGVCEKTVRTKIKFLEEKGLIVSTQKPNSKNRVKMYSSLVDIEGVKSSDVPYYMPQKTTDEEIVFPEPRTYDKGYFDTCELEDFYKSFDIEGAKVEVNNLTTVLDVKEPTDICKYDNENIYFVGGVAPNTTGRAKDADIVKKNYFMVDIDVRKTLLEYNTEPCTDEDIYGYIDAIKEDFKDTEFEKRKYMVMSGNGIHIYYTGDVFEGDSDTYKLAVKDYYEAINVIIAKYGLKCDGATSNISSLHRAIGTLNYGREKYGLQPGMCFVYDKQDVDTRLVNEIQDNAEYVLRKKELQRTLKQHELKSKYKNRKRYNNDNLIADIRSLPALFIWQTYVPQGKAMELSSNGYSLLSPRDGKNSSVFYNENDNVICSNDGSKYINNGPNCMGPFDLVMYEVLNNTSDSSEARKETIKWFKDNLFN